MKGNVLKLKPLNKKKMSVDFYTSSILPYATIIMKICRPYTNSQEDYEDSY